MQVFRHWLHHFRRQSFLNVSQIQSIWFIAIENVFIVVNRRETTIKIIVGITRFSLFIEKSAFLLNGFGSISQFLCDLFIIIPQIMTITPATSKSANIILNKKNKNKTSKSITNKFLSVFFTCKFLTQTIPIVSASKSSVGSAVTTCISIS
jgi:hypothetical protein